MAEVHGIPPPEAFNFSLPEEWPRWKRRFERYRISSKLDKKGEEEQVNTLIYIMGDQADDIMLSLGLSVEDAKKYTTVMSGFDTYFVANRNIIYERAKFNSRVQKEGETANEFITALHGLVQYCEYSTLKDEMLRDRLVVGIRDMTLSEKLQLDSKLTLKIAVDKIRQSEEVKAQQKEIHPNKELDNVVNLVQGRKDRENSFQSYRDSKQMFQSYKKPDKLNCCRRCGQNAVHKRWECPAKNETCFKCQKRGHFASVCLSSKTVGNLGESQSAYLGAVTKGKSSDWLAQISLGESVIDFRVDTGADVTAIPEDIFMKNYSHLRKFAPSKKLFGPDQKLLEVKGMLVEKIEFKGEASMEEIFIVAGLDRPLLGEPALKTLKVVQLRSISKQSEAEGSQITSNVKLQSEYPELFEGLGKIKGQPCSIKLKSEAKPYAVKSPRRIPLPLLKQTKEALDQMVKDGVISPVKEPTEWCAPIVIVPKSDGKIRICIDYTELNKNVMREYHPIPAVEHTLGQLAGAKFFSKLDANSGFWQIELDTEASLLTAIITPFGRFKCNRLPMGVAVAPEHFQRRMGEVLLNMEGVICMMDDILIWASSIKEHDERLREVLNRLKEAGITLNEAKCQVGVEKIKFLGHVVSAEGITPDNEKIEAIQNIDAPTNRSELLTFLGMVNYNGRFIEHLATIAKPLNDLRSNKVEWTWDQVQEKAFSEVKKALTVPPVLAAFDPNRESKITADASSYGLGAVLRQMQENGQCRVVAYASRTLTPTECHYAQIEKEGLALSWACEKFHDYVAGKIIHLETDHKPLVPLFTTKHLDDLSPRLQRIRLRLMRYHYTLKHVPGKQIGAADTLSRNPLKSVNQNGLEEELAAHIGFIIGNIPATDCRMEEIWTVQNRDPTCILLRKYSQDGWPNKEKVDPACLSYWNNRHEIGEFDGIVMRGCRIIVPRELQPEILRRLHEGHFGIVKCRARARESVWWPGLGAEIKEIVEKCTRCIQERTQRHLPLLTTVFPDRPWKRVGMDLFYLKNKWYLIVTDYFSRYPEVARLETQTSSVVIEHVKSIFSRHGVPEEVITDNGPQFGREFKEFSRKYGFHHKTSSPYHAQGNGQAEAAVKVIKQALKKNEDPYLALLSYRSTPLSNGLSPAELLMGRRLRTTVPISSSQLCPYTPNLKSIQQWEECNRNKQKIYFDRRHGVRDQPELTVGEKVWLTDLRREGVIDVKADEPRSYWVSTPRGRLRRNREKLVSHPNSQWEKDMSGQHLTESQDYVEGRAEDPCEQPNGQERVQLEQPTSQGINLEQPGTPRCQGNIPANRVELQVPYRTRAGRSSCPPKRLNL